MKSPKYSLRKCWINYLGLQQLGLSYTAIGVYVCCTTNKYTQFSLQDLVADSNPNTINEIEFAIEELLTAGLLELVPAAVVQGGAA